MKSLKLAASLGLAGVALAAGCSSGPPVIAQVAVRSTVGKNSDPNAVCPIVTTIALKVGNTTDAMIRDNDADQGGTVKFQCSVIPEGTGFKVSGRAELVGVGMKNGTFSVSGLIFPKAMQPSSPNITVSLTTLNETFRSNTCTVTFSGRDQSGNECTKEERDPGDNSLLCTHNPSMDVAAGKIWASVTCNDAKDDAANPPRTCRTTVTFRFENCTQVAM